MTCFVNSFSVWRKRRRDYVLDAASDAATSNVSSCRVSRVVRKSAMIFRSAFVVARPATSANTAVKLGVSYPRRNVKVMLQTTAGVFTCPTALMNDVYHVRNAVRTLDHSLSHVVLFTPLSLILVRGSVQTPSHIYGNRPMFMSTFFRLLS